MQRPESSTLTLTWHASLYVPWIILLACQVRVTVGDLARSLLFCLCDVFRALIYLPCVLVVCIPRSRNYFRSAVQVFIPFADLSLLCVVDVATGVRATRSVAHSEHRFPAILPPKEGCRKPVLGVWISGYSYIIRFRCSSLCACTV